MPVTSIDVPKHFTIKLADVFISNKIVQGYGICGGVSCYCLEYLSEVLVDPSSEKDPKQPGFSCSNNNLNELSHQNSIATFIKSIDYNDGGWQFELWEHYIGVTKRINK